MNRESSLLLVALLSLGACARHQGDIHPVPLPAVSAVPARAADSSAATALPASQTGTLVTGAPAVALRRADSLRADSARRNAALFDRQASSDSAADASALAALNNTSALNSLPPVPIEEAALTLNADAFVDQPRVQYFIDYFTGRGRDRFQIWLSRMPRYEELIRGRMADNRMPGDLVYLALIESGFSSSAVSTASAVGMWQFMTATGRGYGLRVDSWLDERRDPVKATDAAARHLRDLTDQFGSYYLAAAAYNAGAGKVGRGLTRLGNAATPDSGDDAIDLASGEDFFSLADAPRLLRQETKDYVPKLIAATLIAKHQSRYGFDSTVVTIPFSLDSVMVAGGTGLDLIARLADTTLDALRELNPHLLRLVAPPTLATYPIRVPTGAAASVAERYAAIPERDRLALITYRVRAGETVASIAKETGTRADDIRTVNSAARAGKLSAGTTLYLPNTTLPLAMLRDAGTSTTTLTHLVRSGETLGGIAQRYHVTVASIKAANRLPARGTIKVGQRLKIAGRAPAVVVAASKRTTVTKGSKTVSPKAAVATARTHVVQKGETVGGIAAKYGVRQSQLLAVNGLGAKGRITAGQRLKIPA